MSRSRIRASTLRNLVDGYSQTSGQPAPAQNAPKDKLQIPQTIGPENIRTQSLTSNQLVDRTRKVWLPAAAWGAGNGAPVFGPQGGNTNYSAWSMPAAAISSVVTMFRLPTDCTVGGSFVSFLPYWTNLGAGAGNAVWQIQVGAYLNGDNMNTNGAVVAGPTAIAAPAQNVQGGWSITVGSLGITGLGPGILDPSWLLQVKVERDGNNVNDTLANAMGFVGGEISYTADM